MRVRRCGQRMVAEPGGLALGVLAGHQLRSAARPPASVNSPRRWAASSGTPCARIAGSAGSRPSASSARTSSSAPAGQHRGEARGDGGAQFRSAAGRAGWRRSATAPARRRARLPGRKAAPGAAPDLPGAGDRAGCRWDAGGTAVSGPTSASRACRAAGPISFSKTARLRRARPARDRGSAASPRSAQRNRGRVPPVRIGSRPAARARSMPPAPPRATTRRCPVRPRAARRRARAGHVLLVLGRRPRGEHAQLAVHLHGVGIDDRAAQALGQLQRQRRLAACGRAGDDQRGWRPGSASCRDDLSVVGK